MAKTSTKLYDSILAEIKNNPIRTEREIGVFSKLLTNLATEKIGFLDIEASNLSADFGYVFSYALKVIDGPIMGRVLKPNEIKKFIFDKKLMEELVIDLRQFDRIVTHYGTDRKFDIPFLRTRCLKYNLDFPCNKSIYVEDTFIMARSKLRLSRNRLENICDFLGIEAKNHKLNPPIWQKAMAGHKASLEYIWLHNKEDVISLEEVWKKIFQYVHHNKISI